MRTKTYTLRLLLLLLASFCTAALNAKEVENGGYRYELRPVGDAFRIHDIASAWPGDYQEDAPFRIWLLDNQHALGHGEYMDYVFEARSADMLQAVANYSIEFAPSWQRLVVHEISVLRDGQWQHRDAESSITLSRREAGFEAGYYDGNVSALIVFKDVAVGEPMRIRYSVLGVHPLIQKRVGIRSVLAWDRPILERRIAVQAASGQVLSQRVDGRSGEFQLPAGALRSSEGRVSVRLRRTPLLRSVDQIPSDQEPFPYLAVSPQQSWEDVRASAREWFSAAFAAPAEDVAAVARSLGGGGSVDQAEFALRALRHVQEKVRYFAVLIGQSTHHPHPPSEVLARGYGDCKDKAQLLTALLRSEGIDASPALVSAGRRQSIGQDAPDFASFDHVIVLARIGGDSYWLDPTLTAQGGNLETQEFPDYGFALPLHAGEPLDALVEMVRPKTAFSRIEAHEAWVVADDGSTELKSTTIWQGDVANAMRAQIALVGKAKVAADYKQYYERTFGKTSFAEMSYEDVAENNRIAAQERYRFDNLWTHADGDRFADFSAQGGQSYLRLPEAIDRALGLRFVYPNVSIERIQVALPKAGRLLSDPESLRIEDPAFRYERRVERAAQRIEIVHELTSLADHVPYENLAEHLERRRQALDAMSTRIVWRHQNDAAESKAQAQERQERYRRLLDKLREKSL